MLKQAQNSLMGHQGQWWCSSNLQYLGRVQNENLLSLVNKFRLVGICKFIDTQLVINLILSCNAKRLNEVYSNHHIIDTQIELNSTVSVTYALDLNNYKKKAMLISLQIIRFSLTCHLVQVYASINRRNFTTKIVNKKRLLKLYTRAEDTNIFSWLSSRLILSCLNSKELKMKSLELSLLDGEKGIPVTPNIMTLK